MNAPLPSKVKLVEVGPRDGLQSETAFIPSDIKIAFIEQLVDAGCKHIEATSFVSTKKIPQFADSHEVFSRLSPSNTVHYSALVPNLIGFEQALAAGAKNIAIFAAASETFSQKNIHCSIEESLQRFADVTSQAKKHQVNVRAYISCIAQCPYEGPIASEKVAQLAHQLMNLGCYEISLGDTIGVATPKQILPVIDAVSQYVPKSAIAMHFHDTYGQALTNIYASLQAGITTFDCSVSGLGGCPYAGSVSGNVATEEVVYLMQGLHIHTGIQLDKLIAAGKFIDQHLRRRSPSRVQQAMKGH